MTSNATVIQLEDLELKDEPLYGPKPKLGQYLVSSFEDDDVVSYGNHTFLLGLLIAYKMHKSITLTPDVIWLLIAQGFSYHVDHNAEELRQLFVTHQGQKDLVVNRNGMTPQSATKQDWIGIVDEFVDQISANTLQEITATLKPTFTTTTQVSHTAGMITIMATMKHYFRYICNMAVCGFPSITLEGTVEDWESIRDRVVAISKYKLDWWTSQLIPVIEEFVKAKRGEINQSFWNQMIRTEAEKKRRGCLPGYRWSAYYDGWIKVFFPYDIYGSKQYFNRLPSIKKLPSEILQAPFILRVMGTKIKTYNCALEAGFMGMKETKLGPGVYNVKPIIGWGILFDIPKEKEEKPNQRPEREDMEEMRYFPEPELDYSKLEKSPSDDIDDF